MLFFKGLRNPDDLNHNQVEKWFGGKNWENAIRDYNGSGKERTIFNFKAPQKIWYQVFVEQMRKDAKSK